MPGQTQGRRAGRTGPRPAPQKQLPVARRTSIASTARRGGPATSKNSPFAVHCRCRSRRVVAWATFAFTRAPSRRHLSVSSCVSIPPHRFGAHTPGARRPAGGWRPRARRAGKTAPGVWHVLPIRPVAAIGGGGKVSPPKTSWSLLMPIWQRWVRSRAGARGGRRCSR